MKFLFRATILLLLIIDHLALRAQVAINNSSTTPDPSAMLDVSSTSKGMLAPRLTSLQRTAIVSPADGLWVYDTDNKSFWYYKNGSGWQQMAVNPVMLTLPYSATFNSASTLFSLTNTGNGAAANFSNTNNTNTTNTLSVYTNGPGSLGDVTQGNAANFFHDDTFAVGAAIRAETNSMFGNVGTAAVSGIASGTGGYAAWFDHSNTTGYGYTMYAETEGLGTVGYFTTNNESNTYPTLQVHTEGIGNAAVISNMFYPNTSNALEVYSPSVGLTSDKSKGNAGNFFKDNTSGVGAGVRGEVNSAFSNDGTAGVYGIASGTGGYGGFFETSNTSGTSEALFARTAGLGIGGYFITTNTTNTQPTLDVVTIGTGNAANIININGSNTNNTLNVYSNGPGLLSDRSQGNAGNFLMDNTGGIGAGVRGEVNTIYGNLGAAGVYGVASGTGGFAACFEHTETAGFGTTVYIKSNDHGTALLVDHEGDGNLAIFSKGFANKARIDNTGKGFFDGGTQNSGADVAELFDVEDAEKKYEPGDVLQISVNADRTVVKSNEVYSSLVIGVYATKPGVLLTEENIDSTIDGKVPVGVIGVIPTKVCDENGAIHRGDILVASSKPGYAMKADLKKLQPGQSIGKALEDFSVGTGKIKVLVNVR